MPRLLRQQLVVLFTFCTLMKGGCSQAGVVPADFEFTMDVHTLEVGSAQNINIRINAKSKGHFEYYDTGGVIRYGTNDIVMYEADQVVKAGELDLTENELVQLWNPINENRFFEFTAD